MSEGWDLLADEIECLRRLARERYAENADKGTSWMEEEPRWHIYKAIDQMSIASYNYRNGDYEEYEQNMADALNHMMMALNTLGNDYGGCHPVMKDGR